MANKSEAKNSSRHSGQLLMAIALVHQLVGVGFYFDALQAIVQDGVFNSVVAPYWERDAAFWFFQFGFMLFLYGWMTHWLLNHARVLPAFWGWSLLGICLLGVFMMPFSGFWLAIPIALMLIRLKEHSMVASPQMTH